jgi:catechol 2,3-dioxygenase-like lactoylglutathione lyase family enzyme
MARYVEPTEQLVIEIRARDLRKSVGFYRQIGFELISDEADFATLAWESHRLFIGEVPHLPPPADFLQAHMRIMVPNVEDYWKLVNQMSVRIIKAIGDRNYGLRDFTIADPDGFGVRFATRISDLKRSEE